MPVVTSTKKHPWWADLRHGGMLISPPVLEEMFPSSGSLPRHSIQRLRDSYTAFRVWLEKTGDITKGDASPLYRWLDAVLEGFLGHPSEQWLKGSAVPQSLVVKNALGQTIRPHRVLFLDKKCQHPALLMYVDRTKRIGIGRGRVGYSKMLGLLRTTGVKLGLLTNGLQFRLCYAGLDHDSWVEWEASDWFEGGELQRQLDGLVTLLGPISLQRSEEHPPFLLLHAIEVSRGRQSDLSLVLGEQIREAVEILLSEIDIARRKNPELLKTLYRSPEGYDLTDKQMLDALYLASCRLVMRLVILFYAEARGLLPRDLATYNDSYGLEGLFEQLKTAAAHEGELALAEQRGAWPRILSLFRLVHGGQEGGVTHPAIPVKQYGGLLFKEGDPDSADPVLRALSLFEHEDVNIDDLTVYRVLEKIKIGKVKVHRGRTATWVKGPVDFSDLRTEYIGMMYEGLLDYQLRSATEPMVMLNLGKEPILPLRTLERMTDQEIKNLLEKVNKDKEDTGEEEVVYPLEDSEESALFAAEDPAEYEVEDERDDPLAKKKNPTIDLLRERAHRWALRAVEAGKLVRKPRGKKRENVGLYEQEREKKARSLIRQVLADGAFFLVRWGGTRKGSGTFYTKPGLAVPTVHRTLEPLVYWKEENGRQVPRLPEEILSLKVCDPACGSASFLVAALHFLTDGLYRSMVYHDRFKPSGSKGTKLLLFENKAKDASDEVLIPFASDDDRFEDAAKAVLKRYVVERCLYGVDINPMAVELAKLSLWIETMDRELPFTFLDHKIKVGNALVGCWFDRFQDYPALAWVREGGDASHTNGVHYKKNEWTKAIKDFLNQRVKPELVRLIEARAGQGTLQLEGMSIDPEDVHEQALAVFEELHNLQMSADGIQQREELYREKILKNPGIRKLKEAFDTWCAVWFWPADQLDEETPSPANFHRLSPKARQIVRQLADELKFFHWELEFPDVFTSDRAGFDAILGNPPWDVSKPLSMEFFSNYDPIYRTYGKQEALRQQRRRFELEPEMEREWLLYNAHFKAMSNWVKNAARPFGDGKQDGGEKLNLMPRGSQWRRSDELHRMWREQRAGRRGYADENHPFRHQGSADINMYKLFLELAHSLLAQGGRMGMIVPSGIYSDQGCTDLRELFLNHSRWEWLFGFENRKGIFKIHRSAKFCAVVLTKGGQTEAIQTTFMRHDLGDWEQAEQVAIPYRRRQVEKFSPHSKALLEIQSERDLPIVEKMYARSVLLGDDSRDGWGIKYRREFDMTNDSRFFVSRTKLEQKGYRPDEYGRWIGPDGDVMLPLYEGRMIGQFDFSQKGWVSGTGRSAVWQKIPFEEKVIEPQYLVSQSTCAKKEVPGLKIPIMNISSSTNTRTVIGSFLRDFPCGNALNPMRTSSKLIGTLALVSIFNSFCFDYIVRLRLGGNNLNFFVLDETLIPSLRSVSRIPILGLLTAKLNLVQNYFAPEWMRLTQKYSDLMKRPWKFHWAITEHERLRLRCILDAIVAELYGLSYDDMEWILRDDPSNPKGFWRVDKDKPKELRHTTLALAAFRRLKEVGLEKFCAEDWQLPPEVAEQLGPRHLPWQLEGSPEESWRECERHARNLLGNEGFERFMAQQEDDEAEDGEKESVPAQGQLSLDL